MNQIFAQRTLLVNELYKTFQEAHLTTDKDHFTAIVDCFFQILHLPVTDTDLKELNNRLEPIVVTSIESGMDQRRDNFETIAINLEPWLKKLLSLLNPEEYQKYKKSGRYGYGKTAHAYCLYFQLIPLPVKTKKGEKEEKPVFAFPLQEWTNETYKWRNKEAHTATPLDSRELTSQIRNAWIAYLYPVATHFDDLRRIIAQNQLPDLRPYLKGVLQKYQDWKKRFVALKGYDFNYIHREAREQQTDISAETPADAPQKSIEKWRDEVAQEARKSDWQSANNMLVWGAAGTGKSTTLMVLSFQDAEKKLAHYNDLQCPIPVFLPLNILDGRKSMVENIAEELDLSVAETKSLLAKGYLCLYLDGFNEITTRDELQTRRKQEIQRLFKKYPKTFVLLTTRPEDGALFSRMRIFELLPMDKGQIRLFLERNTTKLKTRQIISQRIRLNKKEATMEEESSDTNISQARQLFRLLQTPLFLFYLIQIVDETQAIPGSEAEIIEHFVDQLLDREKKDKDQVQMGETELKLLLGMVGYYSFLKYETNAGMPALWIESLVLKLIKKYRLMVEVQPFLRLMTALNILRLDRKQYVFSHQSFQDFFCSQAELRLFMEDEVAAELDI